MAKGLGLPVLLCKFIQLYSGGAAAVAGAGAESTASSSASPRPFVFIINASSQAPAFRRMLLNQGVAEADLPTIVNADMTADARLKLYARGGCYVVTSRILVVDMLTKRVDPKLVHGLLIGRAHTVTETSNEAFIVRLFTDARLFSDISAKPGSSAARRRPHSFIKAFSDSPESLTSGFAKLAKTMSCLGVRHVLLWPRFHADVRASLEPASTSSAAAAAAAAPAPKVIEIAQPLTPLMMEIQECIVECTEACIGELKRYAHIDTSELTVESGLFRSFDVVLRRQLDPVWFKLGRKTKQLVADLGVLRRLLPDLLRLDCVSFYSVLLDYKRSNQEIGSPSVWLLTDSADRMFRAAKERVFSVEDAPQQKRERKVLRVRLEQNPKVGLLAEDVLSEIHRVEADRLAQGKSSAVGGASCVVFVGDAMTSQELTTQLRETNRDLVLQRRFFLFLHRHYEMLATASVPGASAGSVGGGGSGASSSSAASGGGGRKYKSRAAQESERQQRALARMMNAGVDAAVSATVRSSSFLPSSDDGDVSAPVLSEARRSSLSPEQALLVAEFERLVEERLRIETVRLQEEEQLALWEQALLSQVSALDDGEERGGEEEEEDAEQDEDEDEDELDEGGGGGDGEEASSTVGGNARSGPEKDAQVFEDSSDDDDDDDDVNDGSADAAEAGPGSGADFPERKRAKVLAPARQLARVVPRQVAVVCTRSQLGDRVSVLEEMQPDFVVLYEPSLEATREVEAYQAMHPERRVTVYYLVYQDSVEEQRYLSDLRRERDAFKALIDEKANLVLAAPSASSTSAVIAAAAVEAAARSAPTVYNGSTGEAMMDVSAAKQLRKLKEQRPRVVVDMREFRSSVPLMLYQKGVEVVPITLEVGDYVLSDDVCVERKSIPDLFSSFASGRLYKQAESMRKFYKRPAVLIEFDSARAFSLVTSADLSDDVSHKSILTKLVLLTLHFPELRLLWSPSPDATVEWFLAIRANRLNPDPDKAAALGTAAVVSESGSGSGSGSGLGLGLGLGGDAAAGAGGSERGKKSERDKAREQASAQALAVLRRLPGVTNDNVYRIARNVASLRELCNMSLPKLEKVMQSKANARKLHEFCLKRGAAAAT